MWLRRVLNGAVRAARRRPFSVWYHPDYRLPAASIQVATGLEPRRADFVWCYLRDVGLAGSHMLRKPSRISYEDLARVHSADLLESLQERDQLAKIFALDPSDVHVDEVLRTIRRACAGTIGSAREALQTGHHALNLLGGFHHAGPNRAAGLCPVNDVAVAVAVLRQEGFSERVAVLDLDAHPPDGTAECLASDDAAWIGSISGCDWGPPPGVDETRLPAGAGDTEYLEALKELLGRVPEASLAFVLAGGDVLAEDRSGGLGLSLAAAVERDLLVARAFSHVPTVWLPGGGYSKVAWKVLAGTASVLAIGRGQLPPSDYDPMQRMYASRAESLSISRLRGGDELSTEDVLADLGYPEAQGFRLLGFYTTEGVEYALSRYGAFNHLRRLGYENFRVSLDRHEPGDRLRVFAHFEGKELLLIECVLEQLSLKNKRALYVHWLTLRDPRGRFTDDRPDLPGQEQPGLGLAPEAGQLLEQTAARLGLDGMAFRPAWLHTAHAASQAGLRFLDPERQGRYEAMLRDLNEIPLREASVAISEGRVTMNGERYEWEADLMVSWPAEDAATQSKMQSERERVQFRVQS